MDGRALEVRAASNGVDLPRLVAASQGIRAALVMGTDGEIRAKHGEAAEMLSTSISFGVGVVDLAQRLCEESGAGLLKAHVMLADGGIVVLHHVDESTLVVILATADTPLGALLHDIRYVVRHTDGAEEPRWH